MAGILSGPAGSLMHAHKVVVRCSGFRVECAMSYIEPYVAPLARCMHAGALDRLLGAVRQRHAAELERS